MFAEMSPKCARVVFGSVKARAGSRVGPGVHNRHKRDQGNYQAPKVNEKVRKKTRGGYKPNNPEEG